MKQGFTLIEVLIATAIASLLVITLFFSFTELNNSVIKAGDTTDIFDAALLTDRVLFNDLLGTFIPVQAVRPKKQKKAPEAKPDDKNTKKDEKKDTKDTTKDSDAKKDNEKNGEQKSKVPLLKDPFKSSNRGEQLHQLTFITANPVRVYWGEKTGDPKPSCVRVVYTLEEKKDRKKKEPRYQLYRQEGIKLDLAPYLKEGEIERYLIADNIVSCKLKFIAAVEKEKEKEQDDQNAQKQPAKKEPEKDKKPEIEIKEFNEWVLGNDEKDVRTRIMIPDTVLMTLVLSNAAETRERSFTLRFPIAARFNEVPEQEAPRMGPAQQPGKKPDTGKPEDKDKKEALANGANKIVQNLRTRFGRA